MTVDPTLLDWLLDSDPALRWQVERDLAGAPPERWEATRARIATEGFGAQLLARQDDDGQWAGGAYFPAGFDPAAEPAEPDAQPWTATTWSLNTLRDWSLDSDPVRAARRGGEEYLLQRRLLRTLSTGEPVGGWVTRFGYPFRWFYSVLNAADYLRAACHSDGGPPDPRLAEAIEVIRAARRPDGTWLQERRHPGQVWFEVDVPAGEASKWLTFYGSRVLAWWDETAGS